VEYALHNASKPIGVATYETTRTLPPVAIAFIPGAIYNLYHTAR
jgi:hypothetical protein